MSVADEQVAVTLRLPRALIQEIGASASHGRRTIEDEIRGLIGLGLALEEDPEELATVAAREYSAHLAASGEPRPTTEEMWEKMRRIRDEVADELYPE